MAASGLRYINLTDNTLTGISDTGQTKIVFDTSGSIANIGFQYSTTTFGYEMLPNPATPDLGTLRFRYSQIGTNDIITNDESGKTSLYANDITIRAVNTLMSAAKIYSDSQDAGYLALNDVTNNPRVAAFLSQNTNKATLTLGSDATNIGLYMDELGLNAQKACLSSLVFSANPLSDPNGFGTVSMLVSSGVKFLSIDGQPIGINGVGPLGPTGPIGLSGTNTNTGATGPTGGVGPTGVQGRASNTGSTGPTGPQQFSYPYILVKSSDLNTGTFSVQSNMLDNLYKRMTTTMNISNLDKNGTETTTYIKNIPAGSHIHVLDTARNETSIYLIEDKRFFETTPCQWQLDVRFLTGPSTQFDINNTYNLYFNIAGPSPTPDDPCQIGFIWGLTLTLTYLNTIEQATCGCSATEKLNPVPSKVVFSYSDYICNTGNLQLDVSGAALWFTGLNCGQGLPKYSVINSWQSLANFPDYPIGVNEAFVNCLVTPPASQFRVAYQELNTRLILYKTSMDVFGIQPIDIDSSAGFPEPHVTIKLYW